MKGRYHVLHLGMKTLEGVSELLRISRIIVFHAEQSASGAHNYEEPLLRAIGNFS